MHIYIYIYTYNAYIYIYVYIYICTSDTFKKILLLKVTLSYGYFHVTLYISSYYFIL